MPNKKKRSRTFEYLFVLKKGEEILPVQVQVKDQDIVSVETILLKDERYRGCEVLYVGDIENIYYHEIQATLTDM